MPSLEWQKREAVYSSQILPWVDAFRKRHEVGQSHIVHDFLFEYYRCKRKLITDWHPPLGVIVEGAEAKKFLANSHFSQNACGVFLDTGSISEKIINRIEWIKRLIEAALKRPNQTSCFGLHEWAMLYQSDAIRHQTTPLRLSPAEIESVVASSTIRCTHFDAFRFFTEPAKPLNSLDPTRENRQYNEQFGCVHFNMDLFKWCYKLHPWISSELMLDCFFLAVQARELDMRASPYDLSKLGYSAIPIETVDGRAMYQQQQADIGNKGRRLASSLLKEIGNLTDAYSIRKSCVPT
jgi:hypothetical protein